MSAEEKKIVFATGATRSDIGEALHYLIAPDVIFQIAVLAGRTGVFTRQTPVSHVNLAVESVFTFLREGEKDNGTFFTTPLSMAALRIMYAIDPEFNGGINPACAGNSPSYHLLPGKAIQALAATYADGAKIHGRHNWEKGMEADVILNHFFKHAWEYYGGDTSEDHFGHMLWNLIAANHSLHTWPELNKGKFRIQGKPPQE